MSEAISLLSNFHQKDSNYAQAGAYYTDLTHVQYIANFLDIKKEITVLEPAIGDGSAVKTLMYHANSSNVNYTIFGVDINNEVENLKEEEHMEIICSDFIENFSMSNKEISLVFSNPPYGMDEQGKKRLETLFLRRISPLIKNDGILVWIIPDIMMRNREHLKMLLKRFKVLHVHRFKEKEYKKYKQYVIIARKQCELLSNEQCDEEVEKWIEEIYPNITEIPVMFTGEKVLVPEGRASNIKSFQKKFFDAEEALSILYQNQNKLGFNQKIGDTNHIIVAPVPIKEDSKYLLATSGYGNGIFGSIEKGTIHLMKGSIRKRKHTTYDEEQEEEITVITNHMYSTLVLADGTIKRME